jgi:hypothetical protein
MVEAAAAATQQHSQRKRPRSKRRRDLSLKVTEHRGPRPSKYSWWPTRAETAADTGAAFSFASVDGGASELGRRGGARSLCGKQR